MDVALYVLLLLGTICVGESDAVCSLQNDIQFQNSNINQPEILVANNIGIRDVESRFDLFSSDIFETRLTRKVQNSTYQSETNFKARIRTLIEFIDFGTPGYNPFEDIAFQSVDMLDLLETWQNWDVLDPVNGIYQATSLTGIFNAYANVNTSVDPCQNEAEVPNAADVSMDIDFRSVYVAANTKLAVFIRFEMYQDITVNGLTTRTSFLNDVSQEIIDQFGTVSSVQSEIGPISVLNSIVSVGSATKPEYQVYYSFDTVDHTLIFQGLKLLQT